MGTLGPCWGGCKLGQPRWETVSKPLQTRDPELPGDPATALPGVSQRKRGLERPVHARVPCGVHSRSREVDATGVSTDDELTGQRRCTRAVRGVQALSTERQQRPGWEPSRRPCVCDGVVLSHETARTLATCSQPPGPGGHCVPQPHRQPPQDLSHAWDLHTGAPGPGWWPSGGVGPTAGGSEGTRVSLGVRRGACRLGSGLRADRRRSTTGQRPR